MGAHAARATEVLSAWVELTPQAQVRAIVAAEAGCPALFVDGARLSMALRVGLGPSSPRRADFPVQVCEADLPGGARQVRVAELALPVPKALPQRILVLGDTGCRLKGAAVQDCNDPAAWPFAGVARAAAALAPDLVIHVGDYHYRESPCPAGRGCEGSPWGYGWDAWAADFFTPAQPLLAAAPWIFARGNHEECARAGQGWFRFLAAEPFTPQRSCDDPAADDEADYTSPYAVPLGEDTQVLVLDSARAGNAVLDPTRPKDALTLSRYQADMRQVARQSRRENLNDGAPVRSWFVSHHPVLAFAPNGTRAPYPGNAALQAALRSVSGPAYFPPEVQLALHGHVHMFEAVSFSSKHPATLVAGHGGDSLDDRMPSPLPPGTTPAAGAVIESFTSANRFGFLLMERHRPTNGDWTVRTYSAEGQVLNHCELSADKSLHCADAP